MILLPPLNLFFYNILLGFLDCQYKKTMDGTNPDNSFWRKVPILSTYFGSPEPNFPNPNDILPDLNPYVNALILLPAIFKHRYLKVLLAFVLMWNIVVCKRIFTYYVQLLVSVWDSDLSTTNFVFTFFFGLAVSMSHLVLMYYTAKRPVGLWVLHWRGYR
ncbi:uncharacterized protein LOC110180654 [Drosophila serrata]|uniref:uncharacterized protein LOC110180654 n=1 Tax=Drosophila serrata TaxID=7274 RepID=UPI000A1D3076|nr:uncharacterized protein LOC110180654 [Drosophila serrata]